MNNTAKNYNGKNEIYLSYEEYENLKTQMNSRRTNRIRAERERKAKYFKKQRLFGALIMLAGIGCIVGGKFLEAMILQYFGVAVGVVGLYTMITPQMVLINKYYLERQDKMNQY